MRQYAVLAQKITNLLLKEQEIDTLNYGYKSQETAVVRCLIEDKPVNQAFLIEFLESRKLSVKDRYRTIIIKPDQRYNHSNMTMLETEIHRFFRSIPSALCAVNYPGDYWIVLTDTDFENWRSRIELWAKKYVKIFSAGVGSSESINRQHISSSKADIALKSQKEAGNIVCYDDLVLEIITGSIPENAVCAYKEKVLSALQPEDIHLLKTYFDREMSLKDTAEALFLHKNTIQYQLNRIRQQTGYNPRVFKEAVILYFALRL